jgi:hypothetical protein
MEGKNMDIQKEEFIHQCGLMKEIRFCKNHLITFIKLCKNASTGFEGWNFARNC